MKLLVDMNLTPEWVTFLCAANIDAVHWSTVGAPNAKDEELMRWAAAAGRIVFTNDLDFGALLAAGNANAPSVIQVRVLDLLPAAIGDDVLRLLAAHAEALLNGALVTLDESRTRVRVLPLRLAQIYVEPEPGGSTDQ